MYFSLSYAIGIGLPDNNFGDQELITIADGDDLTNVFKVGSFEEFLAQIDDIVAALQIVTVFLSHYIIYDILSTGTFMHATALHNAASRNQNAIWLIHPFFVLC